MTFAELYNALLRCADDIIGCKMKLVIMTKKSFDILSPENAFSKEIYIVYTEFTDVWVKVLKKYPIDEIKVKTIFAKP